MVELEFAMMDVKIERHAMSPLLLFGLHVGNSTPELPVLNVMLNCQVRMDPTRRQYTDTERERLSDLFGEPGRWGQTLHSFLWAHASVSVPAFDTDCMVDLPVPCTFDFNVAATKYFEGLDDGEVPLEFLFSGSTFYRDAEGQLQIGRIDWRQESNFRLPVSVWRRMMEHYYPDSAWLCLRKEAFDSLQTYKRRRGLATIEQAIHRLVAGEIERAPP